MPQPSGSDLYVSPLLTNISVAYWQNPADFITDIVFPSVPVDLPAGVYFKYNKADWFRIEAKLRGPGSESAGGGWEMAQGTFFTNVYAFHKDVDDQTRASAQSVFDLDRDATQYTITQLRLLKEKMWADKFYAAAVWGQTDQTGVAAGAGANQFLQWNNASSDPVAVLMARMDLMKQSTGLRPNTLVLGPYVYRALLNNPSILDRIKYTNPGGAFLNRQMLASIFEVDRVLVSEAVYNTTIEGTADALTNYDFIFGKSALLLYVPSSPSILTPASGYTFSWRGYTGANNAYAVRTKKFRIEERAADRIESEMAIGLELIATDLGQFFASAVA